MAKHPPAKMGGPKPTKIEAGEEKYNFALRKGQEENCITRQKQVLRIGKAMEARERESKVASFYGVRKESIKAVERRRQGKEGRSVSERRGSVQEEEKKTCE